MKQNTKPLVSICCATYNHEEYIQDALQGFLMQECDFEYEILIHDDASTDKTADIIREYEALYPDKIFPIYQTENQYSQGKKYSDLNYERVRGEYVAICEGDDSWTDPQKLAKQIKEMQEKPEFGISFHKAIVLNIENNSAREMGKYLNINGVVNIEDIINKTHGMIPTASTIITSDIMKKVLEFKSARPYLTVGDIYIHILGALKAKGAIYINEVMSVYRYMTPSSWTKNAQTSFNYKIKHATIMAKSFKELDEMTHHNYSIAFENSTIKRVFHLLSFAYINIYEEKTLAIENFPKLMKLYVQNLIIELNTLINDDEKFILYGAGSAASIILDTIGDKISFIIDHDRSKENSYFMGKKIYQPSKLNTTTNQSRVLVSLIGRKTTLYPTFSEELKKRAVFLDDMLSKKELLRQINFDNYSTLT